MKLFGDFHTHTSFSGDSDTPMELMIRQAIHLGLMELALTDHVDYDYADTTFELTDYTEYTSLLGQMRNKYSDQIKLLLGVEIGFQPHIQNKIDKLISEYDFDFIICSTHMADHLDFYTGAFFEGKDRKTAYLRYFINVINGIKQWQDFDVYGHLDFIVRYGNYGTKLLSYHDFSDIVDEILILLIHNGKGLEINTSGYRYGLTQLHPQFAIIKRYKQLGGEVITVGSDAHKPADIASNFPEAYQLLHDAGFKYFTAFEKRRPRFIKIPR